MSQEPRERGSKIQYIWNELHGVSRSSSFIQAGCFSRRRWLGFTSRSRDEKHPFSLPWLWRLWLSYANWRPSCHLDFVREPDGSDTNKGPLSQTLTVLFFNFHLFLKGTVTVGGVYLHSPSASNGGDSTGSFQSIAKYMVRVDLLGNTAWSAWSALLSQLWGRGLWGLRCRKVKWLSSSQTVIRWYSWDHHPSKPSAPGWDPGGLWPFIVNKTLTDCTFQFWLASSSLKL